ALPLPTRILLQIHHAITGYWWVGLLLGISAIIGFRALVRTDEGRIGWDRFRLMIPGYGRVIRHRYYAQFSRTLGTLMANGIPLLRSPDLATDSAGYHRCDRRPGWSGCFQYSVGRIRDDTQPANQAALKLKTCNQARARIISHAQCYFALSLRYCSPRFAACMHRKH